MTERPPNRYQRRRPSRRPRRFLVTGLAAAAVVAAVVAAVIAYQRVGTPDVEGTLVGYQLVDDQTVSVTMTVTRADPSRPAVCIIRARSIDGTETGRREVLVPASAEDSVQVTALVKTSGPPVVGDVYGCGLTVPSYLVAP